jgi:hypothetical protein
MKRIYNLSEAYELILKNSKPYENLIMRYDAAYQMVLNHLPDFKVLDISVVDIDKDVEYHRLHISSEIKLMEMKRAMEFGEYYLFRIITYKAIADFEINFLHLNDIPPALLRSSKIQTFLDDE